MFQNIICPIDHGNQNIKSENFIFTSALEESHSRPAIGETLYYQGKYHILAGPRIPYMRDKTTDERFFILSLFAVAKEVVKAGRYVQGQIIRVELPVGLPPKHFGTLYRKYEAYFRRDELTEFTYNDMPFSISISKTSAFPQNYAAAMTMYGQINTYSKAIVVDIGGYTMDYLAVRSGVPDLGLCDSLEYGIIKLYNRISSRVSAEYDILLESRDIDSILRQEGGGLNTEVTDAAVTDTVMAMAQVFADDLLGTLRERGVDLKSSCTVFVGGGAVILKEFLQNSGKLGTSLFVSDIHANAKGFKLLYEMENS